MLDCFKFGQILGLRCYLVNIKLFYFKIFLFFKLNFVSYYNHRYAIKMKLPISAILELVCEERIFMIHLKMTFMTFAHFHELILQF